MFTVTESLERTLTVERDLLAPQISAQLDARA